MGTNNSPTIGIIALRFVRVTAGWPTPLDLSRAFSLMVQSIPSGLTTDEALGRHRK